MQIMTKRVRQLSVALALVGLGALVTACSETTKTAPAVGSVVVTPSVASLQTGDTLRLTVTVLDTKGDTLVRTVTLTTSDPAIATVDASGLVTAVAPGSATITVTCEDKVITIAVTVDVPVASVAVAAVTTELEVGDTVALSVAVKDANGNMISRPVTWGSSNPAVATVDSTGRVTAVGMGTATISASSHGKMGSVTLTVGPAAASIEITGARQEPLQVDGTLQLTAVVKDSSGAEIQRTVRWTSSDAAVATVDNTGLVTGKGRGTAMITATAGKARDTASVRVAGATSGDLGNNLSWPVVFAERYGVSGAPMTTGRAGDAATGLRPLPAEGITVDKLPFWNPGNSPDYDSYYMQQGTNTWQAEWVVASAPVRAEAVFDDGLLVHQSTTHDTIRVDVALYDYAGEQLTGYDMTLLYGAPVEMQGADRTTGLFTPTIFTVTPRLLVSKLDTAGGTAQPPLVDQPLFGAAAGETDAARFAAEVTVAGKLVYRYSLNIQSLAPPMPRYGWYRITFELDDAATIGGASVARNAVLDSVAAGSEGATQLYPPRVDPATNRVWVDVCILPANPKESYTCPGGSTSGGGGGGGEH